MKNYTNINTFNPNKKTMLIKNVDIFILENNSIKDFEFVNPIELLIINTSYIYSNDFFESINNSKIKTNTKKIITSDLVVLKYFKFLNKKINEIFPNCNTIVVNSFEHNFYSMSKILDDQKIPNVEYNLNNDICFNNQIYNYKIFFDNFFNGGIENIKNITIRNNIDFVSTSKISDTVAERISNTIITKDMIIKKNYKMYNNIIDLKITEKCFCNYSPNDINLKNEFNNYEENIYLNPIYNSKYINLLNLKYIDKKNNIIIIDKIINFKQNVLFYEGIYL